MIAEHTLSEVVDGKHCAFALPHSDLNGFLFADVGVEASGTRLTVLSTLARLGMDPWQEAGRLAQLPKAAAIDGLARMIASLPAGLWSLPDALTIARRLVALLPPGGGGPELSTTRAAAPWNGMHWAAVVALLVTVLISLALSVVGPPEAASRPARLAPLRPRSRHCRFLPPAFPPADERRKTRTAN